MKDIPGYEGKYAITEDGQVWSHSHNKFLVQNIDKGYYKVVFTINNKSKNFLVHRLVALTYIPNPDNKVTVDHINRNRLDNRVENLRWATKEEQEKNKDITYKNNHLQEITQQAKIVNSKKIEQIDLMSNNQIAVYDSASEAARILFDDVSKSSLIRQCARGTKKSAYGYKWNFI